MAYDGIIGPNLRVMNGLSRDMAYAFVDRVKPAWALVQNDPECAANIAARGVKVVYRQSGDDGQEHPFELGAQEFVNRRIHGVFEPYKDRIWIHITNEIDPSKQVDDFNREASGFAHARGYKACLFNHATNKTKDQWEIHRATLRECLPKGDMAGVHLYDDTVHTAGGYGWLDLKRELGGLWGFTEIAYIRSIFDADHGYRNWSGTPQVPFSAEIHKRLWMSFADIGELEHMPNMAFSLEQWRATPDGAQNGFGYIDNEELINHFVSLNNWNKWSNPVTQIIPKPSGTPVAAVLTKMPSTLVNVRAQPNASAVDLGDLHKGDKVAYYPDAPSNGWVFVIATSFEGWVSLQNGAVVFTTAATPPTPPTESRISYTEQEVADMKALALRLNTILDRGVPSDSGDTF